MFVLICSRTICVSEENSSSETPPPLPPKRRTRTQQLLDESEGLLVTNFDRVSLRSRSPEDSSSLLSASGGSLDSALNHSRDEDEIRAIMGPNDESINDNIDLSLIATMKGKISYTKKSNTTIQTTFKQCCIFKHQLLIELTQTL